MKRQVVTLIAVTLATILICGHHCVESRSAFLTSGPIRRLHTGSQPHRRKALYQNVELKNVNEARATHSYSSQYNSLPRLYVGPRLSLVGICYMSSVSSLGPDKCVSLTPEQAHYLTKVLRMKPNSGTTRRRSFKNHNDGTNATKGLHAVDMTNCVRVFDGSNGEWLARIETDSDKTVKVRQTSATRRKREVEGIQLKSTCIMQLKPQDWQQTGVTLRPEFNQQSEVPLFPFSSLSPVTGPWVLFAPIKKQRAKILIEKCTELGAGMFVPIITNRTDVSAIDYCFSSSFVHEQSGHVWHSATSQEENDVMTGLDKLSIQALEAAEQCDRLTVPGILKNLLFLPTDGSMPARQSDYDRQNVVGKQPWNVAELLQNWNSESSARYGRNLLICRERNATSGGAFGKVIPVLKALEDIEAANRNATAKNKRGVAFLIGPEGGWSSDEIALFDKYCCGNSSGSGFFQSVSLGTTVLRAETAAFMAVGAWNLYNSYKEVQQKGVSARIALVKPE